MALVNPGHRVGPANAPHILEFYLDYCCPFSAKAFDRILPVLAHAEKAYHPNFQFIFRQQVQPWHPQGVMMHEAALAVSKIDPLKFMAYSQILFEKAPNYYDAKTYDQSRSQIYTSLAYLAEPLGISPNAILNLLTLVPSATETHAGNAVTSDLKRLVRLGRQNGIHMSPTALWDGIVESSISSSWDYDTWIKFLDERINA